MLDPAPPQRTDCRSFIEGIVRGYRNSLLTGQNYGNLTQCETIDGITSYYTSWDAEL